MSRIRCLDVSTRIRLNNQKRHFSESQSKKVPFFVSQKRYVSWCCFA